MPEAREAAETKVMFVRGLWAWGWGGGGVSRVVFGKVARG